LRFHRQTPLSGSIKDVIFLILNELITIAKMLRPNGAIQDRAAPHCPANRRGLWGRARQRCCTLNSRVCLQACVQPLLPFLHCGICLWG